MKKAATKLILNRETIRVLSSARLGRAHGAGTYDRVCLGTTDGCDPDPGPAYVDDTGHSGNTAIAVSRNVC